MKKVLSIFLAVVILISGVVFASAKGNDKLQFDENGQFKILALADIQSGFPVGEALKAYITEAIDASNPDLVMFLGDNIMSPEDGTVESYWKGYDEVFPILESKGVPFTFVFGNHDDESAPTVTKEEMLKKYQSYNGCLAYDASRLCNSQSSDSLKRRQKGCLQPLDVRQRRLCFLRERQEKRL